MARVRPPTPRFQVGQTEQGQLVFPSTELIQTLEELIQRAGGLGDVTLLGSLSAGSSTDNALARFDGTDGNRLQASNVTVDDSGNVSVPGGSTVDGRDVSVDGAKLDGIEAGAETNDVDSVFGRTGAVTAQAGDYSTDQVTEATNLYFTNERVDDRVASLIVGGTNVTTTYNDAANTLTINASVPVSSVFSRTGAVTAQASDYDASQVDNDSTVTGSFVSDALDTLDSNKQNSATAGSWTPVLEGKTTTGTNSYSAQTGRYFQIGKLVIAWFRIALDGTSGALDSTGALTISGLPVTPATTLPYAGYPGFYSGLNIGTNHTLGYRIVSGKVDLLERTETSTGAVSDSEATDSLVIDGTVIYEAT